MECNCGSGLNRFPIHDYYGIFCCYACEDCEKDQKRRYRPEILEGPYEADEDIEES
jgi:hypothetical protein